MGLHVLTFFKLSKIMIKDLFQKLFAPKRKANVKRDYEWEKFQAVAKDQFRRLKDKGLSIPVVTL